MPRCSYVVLSLMALAGSVFGKTNTSVTVSSSANPSTYGSSVTFTAVVTPSAATGKVTFKDGSTTLGTGTLSSGKTTFSTSTLTAGSHSITAAYGGDSNYNTSTSSALSQTVNKANTTSTLASSANPSTYGSTVKFTATVAPSGATATVTFKDGSTTLGTGTLSGGKATYSISTLIAGSHSITASYSGDTNYNGSTSSALSQTVNKANSSVTVASSANPSAYGSSVTFTATVTPSTATQTVTFIDGSTTLGTGTLSGGKATFSASSLAVGSHSITASYGGDTNYNASNSSTLKQVVEQASSIALASSTNPSPSNAPVTFTAAVTPPAATGTVTFMDGSAALGTGTLASGIVTFSTSSLALGSHAITAVYGGSSTYAGSTSPILTQNVLTLTSIAVTPATVSLPVGATQQFTATGTFSGGSTGNVTASATWTSSATIVATISTAGVATAADEGPTTIQATVGTVSNSASLIGTPSRFRLTGSLNTARAAHTSTLLPNGKVLIVGGYIQGGSFAGTAELYDPTTGTFSKTGSLVVPRTSHTATLLSSGLVLIAGGYGSDGMGGYTELASAELYNPATGTFSLTGSMSNRRSNHTATLFSNGNVLIVGGSHGLDVGVSEIYNPSTGTFSATGSLNTARDSHTATLLNDGTVLVAGGQGLINGVPVPVAVAELYNPSTGTFANTGSLNPASTSHMAALLSTGKVLIAGGSSASQTLARTEIYDPATKLFSPSGNLITARNQFTATTLSSGQVLLVGGQNNGGLLATSELYDPVSGTASLAGSLNVVRYLHSASLFSNGMVLIAGGFGGPSGSEEPTAETYQSTTTEAPPFSLQITPALVNMVVGGSEQFTAIDNLGLPRLDVTWTVSNASLASVTTNEDNAAMVAGLAAGQVTLTATAEGVAAQEQVTILSQSSFTPGTTIWSAPPVPGFSVTQLVQAVPSANGPDLYSIQTSTDGTRSIIQALQADGEQLWQAPMPPMLNNAVADGLGGMIVTTCAPGSPLTVMDLDATGQTIWQVQAAQVSGYGYICYAPPIAVDGSGVAYVAEPTNAGLPSVTIGNPNSYISSFQFQPSTVNNTNINCCVGPPMINTDGTMYVEYEVRTTSNNVITSDILYLYSQIFGSYTVLSSTTQDEALLPGPIIPDGQGGVLATWTVSPSHSVLPFPYQAADVTKGVVGTPYNLPFSPQSVTPFVSPTLVLGENGVAFASGSTTTTINGALTSVDEIASFSLSSGGLNWTYQGAPANHLSIIEATFGNGLAAKSTDQNSLDTVLLFNSSGVLSPAMRKAFRVASKPMAHVPPALSGFSNIDYYSNGWWVGTSNGTAVAVLGSVLQSAMSSYPHFQGNHTKQSSPAAEIANFETVDTVLNPTQTQTAATLGIRYQDTQATINGNKVSLSKLTKPTFPVYADASFSNYVRQIFKPIDAVAFIGHSLEGTSGSAIGLCFGQTGTDQQTGLPLYPCYSTGQGGYDTPPINGAVYQVIGPVPSLGASQAKIIFFAACDLDTTMQNFIGITNTTVGRALLFPPSLTDIDLDMGEFEWLQILANLEGGQNLKDAVAKANTTTAGNKWYITVNGVQTQVPAQAWQVIGDGGNGGTGIHF